jgi:hypothetical protein
MEGGGGSPRGLYLIHPDTENEVTLYVGRAKDETNGTGIPCIVGF